MAHQWRSHLKNGILHCDHVNDFPVVNSTPGIIQDPIDHLLATSSELPLYYPIPPWLGLGIVSSTTTLKVLLEIKLGSI